MNVLSYAVFSLFVFSIALVVAVLRLDARAALNRTVAVVGGFASIWSFCLVFVYAAPDPQVALQFYHWSYLGILGFVPSMLLVHLVLSGVSRQTRRWVAVGAYGFSVVLVSLYLVDSFYYEAFVPGPWGNVGVASSGQFWSSVSPAVYFAMEIAGFAVLLRARSRASTRRLRAQLTVAALGIPVTYLLYGLFWYLDDVLPVPPLEILTGFWTLGVFLFLIVRYRYGRRDDDLLERHLAEILQEAVALVDAQRRIVGLNPAASRLLARQAAVGQDVGALLDFPEAFDLEWERALQRRAVHISQPHEVAGRTVLVTLSPVYDRHGDFQGAAVRFGPLEALDEQAHRFQLSSREKQVLVLLMQSRSPEQIAAALDLSPATVKSHVHHLFEKTGAANRTQLFARVLDVPAGANVSPG